MTQKRRATLSDGELLEWIERRLGTIEKIAFVPDKPKRGRAGRSAGSKASSRNAGSLGRRLRTAVAAKHGQSVVKVVSYGRGAASVANQLNYIGRRGHTELETRDAGTLSTIADVAEFVKDWAVDFDTKANSRNTVHLVISVKAGTDREKAHQAVRDFARKSFAANHDYVLTRHDDTDHPHSHLIVKLRGDDGRKLDPRKAELQRWREGYARAARRYEILLDASQRRERGQGRKAESMAARKLRERGVPSHAQLLTAQEVFRDAQTRHRSEEKAIERNRREREAYAKLGIALKELADYRAARDSQSLLEELLTQVHSHATSLPKPVSMREEMRALMLSATPPRSVGELLSLHSLRRSESNYQVLPVSHHPPRERGR